MVRVRECQVLVRQRGKKKGSKKEGGSGRRRRTAGPGAYRIRWTSPIHHVSSRRPACTSQLYLLSRRLVHCDCSGHNDNHFWTALHWSLSCDAGRSDWPSRSISHVEGAKINKENLTSRQHPTLVKGLVFCLSLSSWRLEEDKFFCIFIS